MTRARATTAAPRYFKPFHHQASGHIFADGALTFNNPVQIAYNESKLLWSDHLHPDILLSIGTGSVREPELQPEPTLEGESRSAWRYLHRLKVIVTHHTEHSMNSQKAWDNFYAKQLDGTRDLLDRDRELKYRRLNVDFMDQVPKLHEHEQLPLLQSEARSFCEKNQTLIRDTASQLVASLFYLRVEKCARVQPDFQCNGMSKILKRYYKLTR
jgi:hypothetical protein